MSLQWIAIYISIIKNYMIFNEIKAFTSLDIKNSKENQLIMQENK